MLPQPPNHGLGLTIRQQVDDLALLQVAEDRAVAMALPPCPVVDTKDGARNLDRLGLGSVMEFTQQSRSADQQPKLAC
jgi:hypothetical protein